MHEVIAVVCRLKASLLQEGPSAPAPFTLPGGCEVGPRRIVGNDYLWILEAHLVDRASVEYMRMDS